MIELYYIKGLEYLGKKVVIRGKEKDVEAKRFVTVKKTDTMPTEKDVRDVCSKYEDEQRMSGSRADLKKAWVMEINGNKWRKVVDVINL